MIFIHFFHSNNYSLTFIQVGNLQAQIAGSTENKTVVQTQIPFKNNNLKDWSAKIDETGKFKIGLKDNAFSSNGSRYAYIRLLIKGFNTLPEYVSLSFEDLFHPLNGYANFQSLLNTVPVPNDHEGFYLTDKKKIHLSSQYLSTP